MSRLLTSCRVVGRMREVKVPCTRLRDLRWSSRRCLSPEEIQHGTVTRPDGARPEAKGAEPLHAAKLLAVLPQVRRLLHALAGGAGCRRGACLLAAPERGRAACLRQLPPGVCRPQVPLPRHPRPAGRSHASTFPQTSAQPFAQSLECLGTDGLLRGAA